MDNIKNSDLRSLKSYVTALDDRIYSNLSVGKIILDLTHSNLNQRHIEIRFDLHDTLGFLRSRIYQKTGTPPDSQHLKFILKGVIIREIPPRFDDDRMLGYYSLINSTIVHCVDVDPFSASRNGGYEDISLVKKYAMSEKDYDARNGTLRSWVREKKKIDPKFSLMKYTREYKEHPEKKLLFGNQIISSKVDESIIFKPSSKNLDIVYGLDTVNGIESGMRCEASPGNRRGTVAYVGAVPELSAGYWVGIEFDEPVGMNDGTVKGEKRYFQAKGMKYGGFVRAKHLRVGYFPERDLFVDSDNFEDEI